MNAHDLNMMPLLMAYAPALAALAVAGGGALAARGRPAWMPAAGALALLVGWVLLIPNARTVLWPRSLAEHLVLPAIVVLVVSVIVQRAGTWGARWLAGGAALFAAWWMSGAAAARLEFWRVGFAVLVVAWVLKRLGAVQAPRAVAVALTLWGGMVLAMAPSVWIAAALVMLAASVGLLAGKGTAVVPATLLAIGVVGADLGAGRLVRGAIGLADLGCIAAILAPAAVPAAERAMGRRMSRAGTILAPILVAAVAIGVAWVIGRVLRR